MLNLMSGSGSIQTFVCCDGDFLRNLPCDSSPFKHHHLGNMLVIFSNQVRQIRVPLVPNGRNTRWFARVFFLLDISCRFGSCAFLEIQVAEHLLFFELITVPKIGLKIIPLKRNKLIFQVYDPLPTCRLVLPICVTMTSLQVSSM